MASIVGTQVSASAAPAAKLSSMDGPILVNQGTGFSPVTEATVLRVGDRLLSLRGAHAHLIYANGCMVSLKANAMITVADMSHGAPCKLAASQVVDTDFTGDQAQAGVAGVGASGAASAGGLSTLAIAGIGTVAVGAGVGVAAATGAIGGTTSP